MSLLDLFTVSFSLEGDRFGLLAGTMQSGLVSSYWMVWWTPLWISHNMSVHHFNSDRDWYLLSHLVKYHPLTSRKGYNQHLVPGQMTLKHDDQEATLAFFFPDVLLWLAAMQCVYLCFQKKKTNQKNLHTCTDLSAKMVLCDHNKRPWSFSGSFWPSTLQGCWKGNGQNQDNLPRSVVLLLFYNSHNEIHSAFLEKVLSFKLKSPKLIHDDPDDITRVFFSDLIKPSSQTTEDIMQQFFMVQLVKETDHQ